MDIPCWAELVQYGAMEVIEREYGAYLYDTEQDYAISLLIDTENIPPLGREYFPPPGHSPRPPHRRRSAGDSLTGSLTPRCLLACLQLRGTS